jgi:hypothetical protein
VCGFGGLGLSDMLCGPDAEKPEATDFHCTGALFNAKGGQSSAQSGDHSKSAGRRLARAALKELVLCLRRIGLAASVGHFDEAATEYANFRKLISSVPGTLQTAEPWSLFNQVHEAHYGALREIYEAADGSAHGDNTLMRITPSIVRRVGLLPWAVNS